MSRTSAICKEYVNGCCTNGRCYFSSCCYDGPQVQTREHIILAKEVGIPYIVVYINKLDFKLGGDMKELVELEVRELLDPMVFLANYL